MYMWCIKEELPGNSSQGEGEKEREGEESQRECTIWQAQPQPDTGALQSINSSLPFLLGPAMEEVCILWPESVMGVGSGKEGE